MPDFKLSTEHMLIGGAVLAAAYYYYKNNNIEIEKEVRDFTEDLEDGLMNNKCKNIIIIVIVVLLGYFIYTKYVKNFNPHLEEIELPFSDLGSINKSFDAKIYRLVNNPVRDLSGMSLSS
jgi:hypothetical protein